MLKSKTSVINGICNWYTKEIAPLDWKLMLATPFVGKIVKNFFDKNEDTLKLAFNDDNLIDVDFLYEEYKKLLDTSGKSNIEIMNVKLDKNDLDKLYEFIKKE